LEWFPAPKETKAKKEPDTKAAGISTFGQRDPRDHNSFGLDGPQPPSTLAEQNYGEDRFRGT
jgi:hypothetical protein